MKEPEIVKIMEEALPRLKSDLKRDPHIGSHFMQHLTYREIVEITEYIMNLKNTNKTINMIHFPTKDL